jgi:hypothetical protein
VAAALTLGACGGSDEPLPVDRGAQRRQERIDRLERKVDALKAHRRRDSRPTGGFDRFAAGLDGQVGVTLGAPGKGPVTRLGKLAGGSAWSTMKVPIAIRVLDRGASAVQRSEIARALTASDNSAADSLFASLGAPTAAAQAVTEVLRSAGDGSTQVSSAGRGSFSPYGQTDWSLEAQHRFMAALAGGCVGKPASRSTVLGLMGKVTSDRWGLGSAGAPARWKGGWGPGTDGRYLVRQMGVIDTSSGPLVVTLAAVASDGSFESGQGLATELAGWAAANGRSKAGRGRGC